MLISGITLLRFKLPLGSFAALLRSPNFVTLCPSNMYFLLYSTLESVFVDKFGYPCTIDVIFDLEKKLKPISIEVCPEPGSWFTLNTDHYHFYLTRLDPFSFCTTFPFLFLSHFVIVDYHTFLFTYIYVSSSITFSQSSPNVPTESKQYLYLYLLSSYLYLLVLAIYNRFVVTIYSVVSECSD